MIWLLSVGVVLAISIEIPSLIKEKRFKEIGVFFALLFLGIYLGVVQIYNLPFFNPLLKGL